MISSARLFKFGIVLAAAAVLALVMANQGPRPAHALYQDTDGDGAIDIAETVSGSDLNNPNSVPEGTAAQFISGLPLCSDGVDNDGDGQTDLDDLGCHDSDNDIFSDDLEAFVGSNPNSSSSTPEDSRIDAAAEYYGFALHWCGDGIDNDGDGRTDSADPGCAPIGGDSDDFDDATEKRFGSNPSDPSSVPEHELANPGSCSDGRDNDRDGLTDSADAGCSVPANDNRADATTITTLPYTDGPVVVKNATIQAGERAPSCSYGSLFGTIWYRYTATADGVIVADANGSNINTVLAAWADVDGRLQELACDYGYVPPSTGGQPRIAFRASAGRTYYFQVDANTPSGRTGLGTVSFHLNAGAAPGNDQIQDAAVIRGLPFSSNVDTTNATSQPGEPRPTCNYDYALSSAWYKYEPSSDALLVVDTDGSDFDTVVQSYQLTKFGLAPLGCATSQQQGIPFPLPGGPDVPDARPARLALIAKAGQTYYVQVSGASFGVSFGQLALHVAAGVAPVNDSFASARAITALPFSDSVDVLTGSTETGEPLPSCTYSSTGPTVWYRYSPSANGALLIDTEGSDFFYSFVGVYRGTSMDTLTPIACGTPYNSGYSEVGIQVTAGETYYIQAGQFGYYISPPLAGTSGDGDAAGPGPTGSQLVLNVERLDIPSCPAPAYTYTDPTGDTVDRGAFPGGPPLRDITGVGVSSTSQSLCITVDTTQQLDPPDSSSSNGLYMLVAFDADSNRDTGYQGEIDYACGSQALLGTDLSLYTYSTAGIILPFYSPFLPPELPDSPPIEEGENYALLLINDRQAQLIVPLAGLGGDSTLDFALYIGSNAYGPSDCAPNGGHISCAGGSCHLFEEVFGDANCDGVANAVDAVIVLQMNAGMLFDVPCHNLADANRNGFIGPVDAQLILQYSGGLLPALPVPI